MLHFSIFVSISDWIQISSMATNFLSLALASSRLFFSQRLGVFSDPDPSPQMILSVLPVISLHLGMLMYTHLLTLQRSKGFFWIPIVVTMVGQYVLVKMVNSGPRKKAVIEKVYHGSCNQAAVETRQLKVTSVLTSWIAPYTVWVSNKVIKTNFLFYTSMIPITVNILAFTAMSIFYEIPRFNLGGFNKQFYFLIIFYLSALMCF